MAAISEISPVAGQGANRMAALDRLFVKEVRFRLDDIESMFDAADWRHPSPEIRARIQSAIDSLAPAARAFGFPGIGRAAQRLTELLDRSPAPDATAGVDPRAVFKKAFATLRAATTEAEELESSAGGPDEDKRTPRIRRLLLMFEEDTNRASELTFELGCFGFVIRHSTSLDDLAYALPHAAAVILDLDLGSPSATASRALATVTRYRAEATEPPALLLLSPRDDLRSRVHAVRAGADAFFALPLDFRDLVERLEVLVRQHKEEPYRVLLVEEDYTTALGIMLLLQDSGVHVTRIDHAEDALAEISSLSPDVVLADLELSPLSGPELVAVIRQRRELIDLPVVYLCRGAAELDRRLRAMRSGGDDFVELPVSGTQLLPTILHHAQRFRLLRRYRRRDALTGLLNFGSIMEVLDKERIAAARSGHPLVLALLDIDALDAVNRDVGFLGGDSVIRGLAALLRQRLRRTDGLGRFGNRFLLVLPHTTSANAFNVLHEIRILFAEIHRHGGGQPLAVSLSAGVVEGNGGEESQELYAAARAALERAREAGGDRIETLHR